MGGVAAAGGNESLEMILMRARGATDGASSMSQNFRDAMEAMQQMAQQALQILGAIAQVLMSVFGTMSG